LADLLEKLLEGTGISLAEQVVAYEAEPDEFHKECRDLSILRMEQPGAYEAANEPCQSGMFFFWASPTLPPFTMSSAS